MPTAPAAAAALLFGFAVADVTGVRPLGGAVLLAGTGWCAWQWVRRNGLPTAVGLSVLQAALFAASHVIADPIGTWPAVLLVSAASGGAAYVVADSSVVRPKFDSRH